MSASIDSVSPTVATASDPSLDTQKMSTTAKIDSIDISSTIGTARRTTARPTVTSVKSSWLPRMASRIVAKKPEGAVGDVGVSFTGDEVLHTPQPVQQS